MQEKIIVPKMIAIIPKMITVTVVNNTENVVNTKLFSPYRGNTYSSNEGVTIMVNGSTKNYTQLQAYLKHKDLLVKQMIMFAKNAIQFSKKLSFTDYKSTGGSICEVLVPANYKRHDQDDMNQVCIDKFNFVISARHELFFDIEPNESIIFCLSLKKRSKTKTKSSK